MTENIATAPKKAGWRNSTSRYQLVMLLVVLLVVAWAAIAMTYWYNNLHDVSSVAAVERQVNRHYVLPTDEVPVLATVTDSTQLTTPFLQQAKNGDKVLFYQKHQIALIYRPGIDRVIAVGPLIISK